MPRINLIKEARKKFQQRQYNLQYKIKEYFRISNFHQLTGLQLTTINQRFAFAKKIRFAKFGVLQKENHLDVIGDLFHVMSHLMYFYVFKPLGIFSFLI